MSHFASVVHYLPASVDRLRSDDGHREHRPTFLIVCLIAGSYLVPLCPAMNMTYDTGWYGFKDTLKSGAAPSIVLIVAAVLWVYLLGYVWGVA